MDITPKIKQFVTYLQNLPENKKKIILWVIVSILGVILISIWFKVTVNRLSKIGENFGESPFLQIEIPINQISTPTANWQVYKNDEYSFEINYPSDWTYQKFNCNLDGVAFCPLDGNKPSDCGQTCSADSPSSPIYLYLTKKISPQSLVLWDNKYEEVYTNMLFTFKLNN